MQNSSAYFWPYNNKRYLDLNTLKEVKTCVDSCRPPDTYYSKAYCLIEKYTNNMFNCEYNVDNAQGYNNYNNSYNCTPGYAKVYYECIDKNIVPYIFPMFIHFQI